MQAEFGYRPFIGAARADMIRRLDAAALEITGALALAESFIAMLRAGKVIAPAPSTFEKLCSSAVIKAERVVIKRLGAILAPRHLAALDRLLQVAPGARMTPLATVRAPVGAVGAAGFRDLVARIDMLRALDLPDAPGDVPPRQIAKLGRECERLSVGHLGAMPSPRRYALLMAFAQDRLGRLTDAGRNVTPDAARSMAWRLYALLPRVRITDLLEEVDAWTGMSDCFDHLRTGHPPKDRRTLTQPSSPTASVWFGGRSFHWKARFLRLTTRMSEACEGASYWRLARLVDWHVREDTYAFATGMLVEAQDKAAFAHLWGDGSTSSSDGQHFHAGGPARAVTDANARYGTEPGVKFYISARANQPGSGISCKWAPFAARMCW